MDSYYKVRHGLLQIATGITKCDDYYKLRQVLQSAMIITNCDSTSLLQSAMDSYYKLRQLILWHVTDELEKICQRHWKEGLKA